MAYDPSLPLDLGDGLVLRQSRVEDTEQLAAFNADVHRGEAAEPAAWVAGWTRDLMRGNHPTHAPDCFTVVEERGTGRIVSALNLISQTWSYDGVPFGVGRVELVGTAPDYRRRGLIRRQFEVVHRWSAERGELVQAITGIPWYYRQFGYEYALELDHARMLAVHTLPEPSDADARFRLRAAVEADAAICVRADAWGRRRYLVTCQRDEATWRYEIGGRDKAEPGPPVVWIVETANGQPVGYVTHAGRRDGAQLRVQAAELVEGASWQAAAPAIVRGLIEVGNRMAPEPLAELALLLEREHPLYRWMPGEPPRRNRGYAWYLRVPDLPAFLWRIAPVLEARLAASDAAGYDGYVQLWFYRDGLQLTFEGGRLVAIDPWSTEHTRQATAVFPDLTFLQLLFGYRSITELSEIYPDCFARPRGAAALLDVLFPKRISKVYGLA